MRFELIDRAKKDFPVQRLCRMLGVSQSGYFAWRGRSPSARQRQDMVLLAHVRSAFTLSNGTYGSPRMTRELRDQGLAVGRRRTARLMRDNGLCARQKWSCITFGESRTTAGPERPRENCGRRCERRASISLARATGWSIMPNGTGPDCGSAPRSRKGSPFSGEPPDEQITTDALVAARGRSSAPGSVRRL